MVSHQNNTEAGRSDAWMLAAWWAHVLVEKGIGNSGNPEAGGWAPPTGITSRHYTFDIKQPSLGSNAVQQHGALSTHVVPVLQQR